MQRGAESLDDFRYDFVHIYARTLDSNLAGRRVLLGVLLRRVMLSFFKTD
jgi:hypothetical protein